MPILASPKTLLRFLPATLVPSPRNILRPADSIMMGAQSASGLAVVLDQLLSATK
jgi:hypothetical protein